ncbi:hypothetical protein ACHAWF_016178 [Thalassiosira exigua]
MFVNNVAHLVTLSRGIKFFTAEHVPCRTAEQLSKAIKRVIAIYKRGGLKVQTILMDLEFDKVRPQLEGDVVVNCAAAREHVSEIERQIRTVKERTRCVTSVLPFRKLHKLIVVNAVAFSTMWLNAFPVKHGVSQVWSPREIVARTKLSWEKHCQLDFGAYCEVHDELDPTNNNAPRTHEAISMGPTGNFQGSYKFFCLKRGQILVRRRWTELPMPDRVKRKVDAWGARSSGEVYANTLQFRNRNKKGYEWDYEADMDGLVQDDPDVPLPELSAGFPGVELEEE